MKREVFKDVVGYEGLYQISSMGRVKSLGNEHNRKEKILTPQSTRKGYKRVILHDNGQIKAFFVHRLVAEAFIPNPLNLATVNHKNEIKTDNRVENLEWMSLYDNNRYGEHDKNVSKSRSKEILQFTLDGIFVSCYPSARYACELFGFYRTNIARCCRGERNTAYGFIWKYKKETK